MSPTARASVFAAARPTLRSRIANTSVTQNPRCTITPSTPTTVVPMTVPAGAPLSTWPSAMPKAAHGRNDPQQQLQQPPPLEVVAGTDEERRPVGVAGGELVRVAELVEDGALGVIARLAAVDAGVDGVADGCLELGR